MWLDRLKEMKNKSGLTTRQIAEQSGLPEPTLVKLFAGVTKDPKLTTVQQLVHFFGHTLDDLADMPTQNHPNIILSEEERRLVSDYKSLSPDGKAYIQQQMTIACALYTEKNNAFSDVEEAQ